jgi:PleD family two-component response regulator
LTITVSLGATSARHSDARIDDVLIRADEALYASKRTGRNRVTLV